MVLFNNRGRVKGWFVMILFSLLFAVVVSARSEWVRPSEVNTTVNISNTDQLPEGTTNLYFTDDRVRSVVNDSNVSVLHAEDPSNNIVPLQVDSSGALKLSLVNQVNGTSETSSNTTIFHGVNVSDATIIPLSITGDGQLRISVEGLTSTGGSSSNGTNTSLLHGFNSTGGFNPVSITSSGALKMSLQGVTTTVEATNSSIFHGVNESSGLPIPLTITGSGSLRLSVSEDDTFSDGVKDQTNQALCMRVDRTIGYCTTSVNVTGGCTCV